VGFNIFLPSRFFILILIFIFIPVIFELTIVFRVVYVVDIVVFFIAWDGDLIVLLFFFVVFVSIICESFSAGLLEHVCDTVWE
jgi:hypothetical protein